jgi:MFS family permease
MLVIVGASMMAVFATVTSLVQLITTNEMRGRVMSVYNCAFRGGMPMGNLLSGWLVPMFTAPVVLSGRRTRPEGAKDKLRNSPWGRLSSRAHSPVEVPQTLTQPKIPHPTQLPAITRI